MKRVALAAAVLTFASAANVWCQTMRPSDLNVLPVSAPTLVAHYGQYLVASVVLTSEAAAAYRARAVAGGDKVQLLQVVDGGHFDIIAPKTVPGMQVKAFVETALAKSSQP